MKLIITRHAFERYLERVVACQYDFYHFQNRFQKASKKIFVF